MLIQEFEKKYGLQRSTEGDIELTLDNYCDKKYYDEQGHLIRAVITDAGDDIDLEDIISLSESDFKAIYTKEEDWAVRTKFFKIFTLHEGAEVLSIITNRIKKRVASQTVPEVLKPW